jgi:hypothetical protein
MHRLLVHAHPSPVHAFPAQVARAPLTATGLRFALDAFPVGEPGRWSGWYRGDTKMTLARLLNRIESLASAALPPWGRQRTCSPALFIAKSPRRPCPDRRIENIDMPVPHRLPCGNDGNKSRT